MQTDLSPLENRIGHAFTDRSQLELALTHPSCNDLDFDNQRLEFLGDAVLDLLVAERLYTDHPQHDEGSLDRMRAGLVNGRALAAKAREIKLGDFLRVSEAQRQHHSEPSSGMLEDALEAVIGAVFLDGGLEAARTCVTALLDAELREAEAHFAGRNPKSQLQEWSQQHHEGLMPEYRDIAAEGPDHARSYTSAVFLNDKEMGRGSGPSKKAAETAAALDAYQKIEYP